MRGWFRYVFLWSLNRRLEHFSWLAAKHMPVTIAKWVLVRAAVEAQDRFGGAAGETTYVLMYKALTERK